MKFIFAILLVCLCLISCGENASPEGRMTKKINTLQDEMDSLTKQNAIILDSLNKLMEKVNKMEEKMNQ